MCTKSSLFFMIFVILFTFNFGIQMTFASALSNSHRKFWVLDTWKSTNGIDDDNDHLTDFTEDDWDEAIYEVHANLAISSSFINLYIDEVVTKSDNFIQDITVHSEELFPLLVENIGTFPDINADERITILITDIRDRNYYGYSNEFVQGFFWTVQSQPAKSYGVQFYSHEEEIIYLDSTLSSQEGISVIIHELQHLIQFSKHKNQALWLDEGFSIFCQELCGFSQDTTDYANYYLCNGQPNTTSLTYFTSTIESYGLSYLFVKYLVSKFNMSIIKEIIDQDAVGIDSISYAMNNRQSKIINPYIMISNFSMALTINSIPYYQFNGLFRHVKPFLLEIGEKRTHSLAAWSYLPLKIDNLNSTLYCAFSSDQFDTEGNGAFYWINICNYNATQMSSTIYFVDPLAGKAKWLIPRSKIQNSHTIIVFNVFSGSSSGPRIGTPPYNKFELFTEEYNKGCLFFPGYVFIKNGYLLNVGVRVFDTDSTEWTDKNTVVAKYQIINSATDEILIEDSLLFSNSGWLIPNVNINTFNNIHQIKIRYILYNDIETITFETLPFLLKKGGTVSIQGLLEIGMTLSFLIGVIVILGFVFHNIKHKQAIKEPFKLTNLPRLNLEDKEPKEVTKFRRRRINY